MCRVVGTEEVVRTRRNIYMAAEILLEGRLWKWIASGSKAEGIHFEGGDFDMMFLDKSLRIHENDRVVIEKQLNAQCLLDSLNTKLGFVRLKLNQRSSLDEFHIKSSEYHGDNLYLSSRRIRESDLQNDFDIHGPCHSTLDGAAEYLVCFRCKQWISLAETWVRRNRNEWPRSDLISEIVQDGVLFVPVGCKTSQFENLEWRISFSVAERKLVHSFSHTQLLCYAALKLIVSDIIKVRHREVLCSYFIKTVMFWVSEESDPDDWKPENYTRCFEKCFRRLIYCVEYEICFHYFIPEINFFENRFSKEGHESLLCSLKSLYDLGVNSVQLTHTVEKCLPLLSSLTSSVVCDLAFLQVFFQHKKDISTTYMLNKVVPWTKHCEKSFKLIVRLFFSLQFSGDAIGMSNINSVNNKHIYRRYKKKMAYILMASKGSTVSGWCLLACLFYKFKQYQLCRSLIQMSQVNATTDKVSITNEPYISVNSPVNVATQTKKGIHCFSLLKHELVLPLIFMSTGLLPDELFPCFNENNKRISISTMVLVHFLDFLCAHHLGNHFDKDRIFTNLAQTIKSGYTGVITPNYNALESVLHCLEICMIF